jgi:hypothetical protein
MQLFDNFKQLVKSEYIFRILDNGGATFDRLTVIFADGDFLGMSWTGQGFSQWGGPAGLEVESEIEAGTLVDLAPGDLCLEARAHVLRRVNEGWRDFLADIEARKSIAVAPSREEAEKNEYSHDSAGKGIYSVGHGYAVKRDCEDADDDRGPFLSAAEALRATLPDEYSLAGPEYQSGQNMQRATKCQKTARRIRALEKKVESNA